MPGTIVVKLQGGLGNQLFQYTTGRALADRYGAKLTLDLYHLFSTLQYTRRETPRAYALQPYTIHATLLQPTPGITATLLPRRLLRWQWAKRHYRQYPIVFTESDDLNEMGTALGQGNTILLDGYFQEEIHFLSIREALLQELQPKTPLPETYRAWADQARTAASVAVHIRRGDYVHNAGAAALHGVLPESYYRHAISLIQEKVNEPLFFFFSDDIEWVKSHFADTGGIFISSPEGTPHHDLELMRQCRHQVIANSSFSWWGAWLNTHPDKVVIAPEQWFADKEMNRRISLPENWLRI